MKEQGLLLVISGPSGVGKGTLIQMLLERNDNIHMSVSATTRGKRPGEIESVHYYFKSHEEFEEMIAQDAFLEYMRVFGTHYYGTPAAPVAQKRAQGIDVILEIDVQGAMKVRKVCPDAVMIFIAPPTIEELRSRLIGRGTEDEETVERRFRTAFDELKRMPDYDYVVVNDTREDALKRIEGIIETEKCRVARNTEWIEKLLGGMKAYDEQTPAQ
jgi:guanylate kinase